LSGCISTAPAEGGIQRNCIGRSRGGLTTKVHTSANAEGLAVGFHVTPGQASGMTAYDDLMAEDVPLPGSMLGDKGYNSDAIRSDLERRGIDPVIPNKSNRKMQRTIDKASY
jgi:transposase